MIQEMGLLVEKKCWNESGNETSELYSLVCSMQTRIIKTGGFRKLLQWTFQPPKGTYVPIHAGRNESTNTFFSQGCSLLSYYFSNMWDLIVKEVWWWETLTRMHGKGQAAIWVPQQARSSFWKSASDLNLGRWCAEGRKTKLKENKTCQGSLLGLDFILYLVKFSEDIHCLDRVFIVVSVCLLYLCALGWKVWSPKGVIRPMSHCGDGRKAWSRFQDSWSS